MYVEVDPTSQVPVEAHCTALVLAFGKEQVELLDDAKTARGRVE